MEEYHLAHTYLNGPSFSHNVPSEMIVSSFLCEVCYENFSEESALKNHVCTQIDENNSNFDEYSHPECTSRDPIQNSWVCGICNESFLSSSKLNKHLQIHNGEDDFVCLKCNKTFIDKCLLRYHFCNSMVKPLICKVCRKPFARLEAFEKHKLSHTSRKPFQCEKCLKTSCRKDYLEKGAIKNAYLCDICGELFNENCTFMKHIQTHTSEG